MLPDISDVDITDLGDVFDDSMLGLTFNGVGATIDLGLTAAASGDFSVPLLILESPIGVSVCCPQTPAFAELHPSIS